MYELAAELSTEVPGLFTSGEVRRIVGLTQRKLTYWDDPTLVRPQGRPARGSGSRRLYTLLDVVQLKLILRLREAGLSLQKIRRALLNLSDLVDEPAPLSELEIVSDGHRILVRRSDDQLIDPLDKQYVLRLPLADLLVEIERKVASGTQNGLNPGVEGISSVRVLP